MSNLKQLSNLFKQLPVQKQQSLIDFAEFLLQSSTDLTPKKFAEPILSTRAEGETVISAIKRLKASYSMLNMDPLLNETSTFMAQYMVQGRDVNEVIDDLEVCFAEHYEKQKLEYEKTS